MMLHFSGDLSTNAGLTKPSDLHISFLVDLVAVAVRAMMHALLDNSPLISPRQE